MNVWLSQEGWPVSRRRVQRLKHIMGLRAIYRSRRTRRSVPEHRGRHPQPVPDLRPQSGLAPRGHYPAAHQGGPRLTDAVAGG